MASPAPHIGIRQLEAEVKRITSLTDAAELDRTSQQQVRELKAAVIDARLELRDYEFAETRSEQIAHGKVVRESLERVRGLILATSQADIFGPVEVAYLSASIDQLQEATT